jgi:hypothetical protein
MHLFEDNEWVEDINEFFLKGYNVIDCHKI